MSDDARRLIVATSRNWIGTPYRHQASVQRAGCDCLGLVRGVWRDLIGAEVELVPPYSPDWGETGNRDLLYDAAKRHMREVALPGRSGDVVLFRMRKGAIAKHLGILTEDGARFVHAYSRHGVVESALTEAWRRRAVAAFEFPFERI